ncbi:hypothetical protein [Aquamicrobium sp. LC103]|uniref:hypothetical protein n=1 Tax=Aquamicrobium sp. LC103 TaxID=1120658 RepID=UPI00069B841E|nr:hypothetical protein [Aquamicrobium sp. LC103]TKT74905.1 hypothetical protein XW59_020725 [Aquamicrobium sp. LC103]
MLFRSFAGIAAALTITLSTAAFSQEVDEPRQILFVGNSYFYYNDSLHNHVSRLLQEAQGLPGSDLRYRSITISGGSLSHHPIAHYLTENAVGYDTPFDVVILQGHSAAANSDSRRAAFRDAVIAADGLIRRHGARTALYMTHAYAEGHDSYDAEGTNRLADLYSKVGAEIDAAVIPVGLAFEEAKRRRPDIELHVEFDHSHPSLLGTYLAAATTYATLYEASPVGLSYDYYGRIDAEDVAFLQQVAADTVETFQAR